MGISVHAKNISELFVNPKNIPKPGLRCTTSPSGQHLGWYKALFAPGPLEETTTKPHQQRDSTISFEQQQEAISSLLLSVLNYCIRWKTIVNVMILKEQGNIKIHRLRVIHLYVI